MRNYERSIVTILVVSFSLSMGITFIQAEEGTASVNETADRPKMTKEQMLTDIKESLMEEDEAFDFLPDVTKRTTPSGTTEYLYQGVLLDDLGTDKLREALIHVNQAVSQARVNRLNKQLQAIRHDQQLQQLRRPMTPPSASVPPYVPAQPAQPLSYREPRLPPPEPPKK